MGVPDGTLDKPTSVSATDGSFSDKVRVTWAAVTGAANYFIFRSFANDSTTAGTPIGQTTGLNYDDTATTVGQVYYYWVRAVAAGNSSPLSLSDSGYLGSGVAAGSVSFTTPGSHPWSVPAGVTSINISLVSGGGGGGAGQISYYQINTVQGSGTAGGGGGGAGGVGAQTGISVTPAETLIVNVGDGGAAAALFGQSGQSGTPSSVLRVSTSLLGSGGGGGGHGGYFPDGSPQTSPVDGQGGAGGPGSGSGGFAGGNGGNGSNRGVIQIAFGGYGAPNPALGAGHGGNGQSMTRGGAANAPGRGAAGAVVISWS